MSAETRLNEELRRRSAPARAKGIPFVIGVAGSVAVGKSTFATALGTQIAAGPGRPSVVNVATDGYLFPNAILAEHGISMRKGFPESYDVAALRAALEEIKDGERVPIPRYSHITYDVDIENALVVERPTVLILDGLHLAQIETSGRKRLIDCLIYLDAPEEVIESWFTNRLLPLMVAGRDDPRSFYYAFREMSDDDRRNFSARVWREINLPNLRDHIVKDRAAADIVITKNPDHSIAAIGP
jgi:type I pantothenate kinase